MQVFYSLISSLKIYHPTLRFTPWSLDLFIRVPFQLPGEHTVLQSFRCIELIVHIAISVPPSTHFHLIQVKRLRVKCLVQGQNILTMSQYWEGRNMGSYLKILHQAGIETAQQAATSAKLRALTIAPYVPLMIWWLISLFSFVNEELILVYFQSVVFVLDGWRFLVKISCWINFYFNSWPANMWYYPNAELMPVQHCRQGPNINTTIRRCSVNDGNATRKISQHFVTCALIDETWRWPVDGCSGPITVRYAILQMIDSSTSSDSTSRIRRST